MKLKNNILIIILIIVLYIIIKYLYFLNNTNINTLQVVLNKTGYVMQEYNEEYLGLKINYYYPITQYLKLNNYINKEMKFYINKYKEYINENKNYYLLCTYEIYEINNYISIIYHVMFDFRGAHPETIIYTINYDKENNKIIDIDYLINNNKEILNLLSNFTFNKLKNIYKENIDILKDGTRPIKNNFRNFIFCNDGIKFYFERYQIAPYSYGETGVLVPYKYFKNRRIEYEKF